MGIAVGIDLGTTNSAVSVVRPTGKPEVLKNKEGDSITPSVVLFQSFGGPDEPLVGEQAKRQAAAFPDDIVQHVKRYMGDPSWRFDSSSGAQYSAEEVSAIILKRLKLRWAKKSLMLLLQFLRTLMMPAEPLRNRLVRLPG